MTGNMSEWQQRIDDYYAAWAIETGRPNFERLSQIYAEDPDIIFYDILPPLEGYRGFDALQREVYADIVRMTATPNKDLRVWMLAEGRVAITAQTYRQSIVFRTGKSFAVDARETDVWERRDGRWRIVHAHASSVIAP